jgi:hypothetical protein
MSQTIRTLLHILAEQEVFAYDTSGRPVGNGHRIKEDPKMQRMMKVPHFVIQDDALELMSRADIAATITALHEAQLTRLPYPEILIEYNEHSKGGSPEFRHFVMLEEVDGHKAFAPTWAFWDMRNRIGGMQKIPARLSFRDNGKMAFEYTDFGQTKRMRDILEHGAQCARFAADICFMLLNTRGIEKEIIECAALNKHRVAKGKTAVPTHRYVHIAKVYRRDGTHESYAAGHHKRMHLRKGYTRRQHYGPKNELEKIVYIEPVIVNFDPEQKMDHTPKIVMA